MELQGCAPTAGFFFFFSLHSRIHSHSSLDARSYMHRQSRLMFVHSYSLEGEEEELGLKEEEGEGGNTSSFFRIILDDQSLGPCAKHYRFEVSFSPSIVLPCQPKSQQERGKEGGKGKDEEEPPPPWLCKAPLELRFYDQRIEEYLDEEVPFTGWNRRLVGGEYCESFSDMTRHKLLVRFFLRFLINRTGAWSRR